MKTTTLSVDVLRMDGNTQNRLNLSSDTASDYASIISENGSGWPFPPLDVFHDGTEYFMADGFHRLMGAKEAGRASVPCRIHRGNAVDARIFGMTANDKNGLRMTRAEKRACVEWLLDQPGKMTQKAIAEKAGVGLRLVKMIVADRNSTSIAGKASPPKRECKGQNAPSTPSRGGNTSGSAEPESTDYGKCPNCEGCEWDEDDEGIACSKCHHPHGEPVGDEDAPDPKKLKKLAHAYRDNLARAICDYHEIKPNRKQRDRLVKLVQEVSLW